MSEVIQDTQQEFWRPPTPALASDIVVREAIPTMAETCARCGTEFLLGSRFCHSCGGRRPEAISQPTRTDAAAMAGLWQHGVARAQSLVAEFSWSKIPFPSWLRYLHFHEIKSWTGLSTASLIAFVIGIGMHCRCVAGGPLDGKKLCRVASDPVLPWGMVAGGYGFVRGRHPAQNSSQSRSRLTLFPAGSQSQATCQTLNARSLPICGLLTTPLPEPAARFCWLMR